MRHCCPRTSECGNQRLICVPTRWDGCTTTANLLLDWSCFHAAFRHWMHGEAALLWTAILQAEHLQIRVHFGRWWHFEHLQILLQQQLLHLLPRFSCSEIFLLRYFLTCSFPPFSPHQSITNVGRLCLQSKLLNIKFNAFSFAINRFSVLARSWAVWCFSPSRSSFLHPLFPYNSSAPCRIWLISRLFLKPSWPCFKSLRKRDGLNLWSFLECPIV